MTLTHPLLEQAKAQQPDILSVFWKGQQVLRIEHGETVLDEQVVPGAGLLTIHFDDNAKPAYSTVLEDSTTQKGISHAKE